MGSRPVRIHPAVVAGFLLLPGMPGAQEGPGMELCCNARDDDQDFRIDHSDPDCATHPPCWLKVFHRGDASTDGQLDVADAMHILSFLFGGSPLPCREAADADDDGEILVTDALVVLQYLFLNGPPPAPPGPPGGRCGTDPEDSPQLLGCAHYPSC